VHTSNPSGSHPAECPSPPCLAPHSHTPPHPLTWRPEACVEDARPGGHHRLHVHALKPNGRQALRCGLHQVPVHVDDAARVWCWETMGRGKRGGQNAGQQMVEEVRLSAGPDFLAQRKNRLLCGQWVEGGPENALCSVGRGGRGRFAGCVGPPSLHTHHPPNHVLHHVPHVQHFCRSHPLGCPSVPLPPPLKPSEAHAPLPPTPPKGAATH
jgi:hypothetical protein